MTEPRIKEPKMKKKSKGVKDQADTIFSLCYVLLVILISIPTWIGVLQAPDARIGVAFLKFTALFTILARPFTLLVSLGSATNDLVNIAFPGLGTLLQDRYPEITDFNALYQGYIAVPDFVFLIPFIFLVFALVYLGYKTPPEKNAIVEGIKFALGHYLGGIAGFVVFWGIGGMIAGFWDLGFVLTHLFATWTTYLLDFVLWIGISIFLVAVGNFAAGRKPMNEREAAQYLVSSLQQPTPRAFAVQERVYVKATSSAEQAQPVETPPAVVPVVIPRRYCEFCGSKIDAGTRFCMGCGVVLEAVPAPVPEAPVKAVPVAAPLGATPAIAVELPAPRRPAVAVSQHPAQKPAAEKPKQKPLTEKQIEELERSLHEVDEHTQKVGLVLVCIGVFIGLVSALAGHPRVLASILLSLPMGIIALIKDRDVFSKWIFERNYSSRGVDLIIWGAMGTACSGAGLLILVKGIMMLVLTQNLPKQYPTLNSQQWRARVFQASTTLAGTWMLLSTIAGMSQFFEFNPVSIAFAVIATFVGFAVYFVYTRFIHPEIIKGRINDMDMPLIVAGICGMILNGGGLLILIQGILIAVQKDEKKKPDALVKIETAEPAAAAPAATQETKDEKPSASP
nr:hypothetical protein [Candidatus Sigynarchaeota archaeon]